MRAVFAFLVLCASAHAFFFARKEFLKQNYPEFKDVHEIAKVIAEYRSRAVVKGDAVPQSVKDHVQKLKASMKPIPGAPDRGIDEINAELGVDEFLVEGDIVMTLEEVKKYYARLEHRSKRQAFQGHDKVGDFGYPDTLWEGTINYAFDPRFANEEAHNAINDGVKFWQDNTCLRFQKVDDFRNVPKSKNPLLMFHGNGGCSSRVGRNPTVHLQAVSIGPTCEHVRVTTHEIAHALGFVHEQSRWDRNQFITVETDNIQTKMLSEYSLTAKADNDNYGKQYDYRGIMHYFDNALAKEKNLTTMYAKNPDYQMSIGEAELPGFGDIYEMNTLYSCYDRCANAGTVCQNEGRPNPNKCSECQCPSGFGGVDCSERQAPSEGLSCGESLKASYQWQTLNVDSVVGTGSAIVANRTNPHQCTWHIQAPKGKKIQYKVDYIGHSGNEDALCYTRCIFGGLSLKGLEATWMPEGMRVCCKKQYEEKTWTTASNLLIIQPWNRERYTDFTIQYKIDGTEGDSTPAPTTTQAPVNYHRYGNFIFGLSYLPFAEAEVFCQSQGAHLMSYHNDERQAQVYQAFQILEPNVEHVFWLGLRKPEGVNSRFAWVDGSSLDYTNWPEGLPREETEAECVAFYGPRWVALPCHFKQPFACEIKRN